jgi:ribokinase
VTSVGVEVLVIGDALLDVTARPTWPMRSGADVPARISLGPGGQGANLAVRLARRGVRVGLICGLGVGRAGALVSDGLRSEGVELITVPVADTGTVVIVLGERGERTMLSQRAPFSARATAAMPPDPEWIVVSGYVLLEPDAHDLAQAIAARSARRVLLGCAMPDAAAAVGWASAATAMRPDLLVLNAAEADEIDRAATITTGRVTTSEWAVRATIGGVSAEARTPAGEPAIDTTGSGDAFAAGLVAALARAEWPPTISVLEAALGSATTLASAVARTPGAQGRVAGEQAATLRP